MEEAIKKIIEMLEAGKITAEDAERLIKAVKETSKKEKEFFDLRWVPEVVKIPEIIEKSIKKAMHSAFGVSKVKGRIKTGIPSKDVIKVESYNGNIKIISKGSENIMIDAEDTEFEEKENEVLINSYDGDIEIFIPEEKPIPLIILNTYNGEIEARGNFKRIEIETYSGDIYIDAEFDEINIETYCGDCELKTQRKSITVKVDTYEGEIMLPSGFQKEGNIYIYGEGEYKKINFGSYEGNFELKFKEV